MLKNYIKIALRNIRKNPWFSAINIGGLAIGITACLLIAQYVAFETSYDDFHQKSNQLYRISVDMYENGVLQTQSARVAPAVATSFTDEIPEIDKYARLIILGPDGVLTSGDKAISEPDIYLAENSFLDLFSFPLLQGDPAQALTKPFTVVISQNTANSLFGNEDPIGKTIVINSDNFDGQSLDYEVTGVMKNIPQNSHIQPEVLISYSTLHTFVGNMFDNSWTWSETYSYVQLNDQADPEKAESFFSDIYKRSNPNGPDWRYHLQPVTEIHLHSELQHEATANGNATYVYFMVLVSVLILIVGYINYTNLTTLKAEQRSTEIGIRKVSGANRFQLMVQFVMESSIINFTALILALSLTEVFSPYFSSLFGIPVTSLTGSLGGIWFWPIMAGSFIILTVLSSLYPAYVISRLTPSETIKGKVTSNFSGARLQKVLVATQFAVFVLLLSVTFTISSQIDFLKTQDLGFNSEQVLIVKAPKSVLGSGESDFTVFKDKVSSIAGVTGVSGSETVPGQEIYRFTDQIRINQTPVNGVFSQLAVTPDYFDQYGITFLAGDSFPDPDSQDWVINQKAAEIMGFETASEAIGKEVMINDHPHSIKGVITNYHHENLKNAVEPVIFSATDDANYFSVKTSAADIEPLLSSVGTNYASLFPGSPFEYFFLTDFYNQKYELEDQFSLLFRIFSILSIVIALIGLLGLSGFSIHRRTKEIGIRKVLGAGIGNILLLVSQEFMILVLAGSAVAAPLAWYLLNNWLSGFAYKTEINIWIFGISALLALMMALITISWQATKAAIANPVDSLRNE